MLAEIFILRLETAARVPKEADIDLNPFQLFFTDSWAKRARRIR
jgi:hypothetical protein